MIRGSVKFSVKRRVTILMLCLAVVAFGTVGFLRLPLNLLPDISYPSFTVRTEFANAAPGEVENLVTKPVEEAVGVLKGLREVHSVSRAGMSEVTLEFGWGTEMDPISMDIREKLDRLILPDEVDRPVLLRYDPALDPIMRFALSGSEDLRLLRFIAEEKLKDELEKIEGVASAQIKGGEEEEIQINIDQGKVAAMGISPAELEAVLAGSNINRPGGSLKGSESLYLVRTLNEFDTVEEIADLTITPSGGPPVRLRDVATVIRGVQDREEITRVNGRECVVIEIFKEGDANTVVVAEGVFGSLWKVRKHLAEGMKFNLLFNQARFIKQSIEEVRSALIVGGILAVLILIIFLRDFRATVIIATSIPISVIATFILMYMMDVSLNIMSLGGLTLGIGMLVDSSIVVLEAVYRKRDLGLSRAVAAVEGTSEVGGAVIASTLTTIAVFFPIVFVEGIAGQLFRDQSLTVTFSLVASLLVSLSLIPMLASLGKSEKSLSVEEIKNRDMENVKTGPFMRAYESFLRSALKMRWLTLIIAIIVFAASIQIVPTLKTELIPALTEGEFFFEVTMPEGTSLPATNQVMLDMEAAAMEKPGVDLVYSSVGSRSVSGGISLKTRDENLGQVNVVMADRGDDAAEARVAGELRDNFDLIPNLDSKLGRPSFFSLKTPIELVFYGEDLEQLREYSLALKNKVAAMEGLVNVRASLESGNPELNVVFDRDKLAHMGMHISDLSTVLHDRVNGKVVSRFKEGDRQIDIRLRNREIDRDSVSDIENIVIGQKDGVPVMLKAVAKLEAARGPSEIHRVQQSRAAIISADLQGRGLGGAVAELEALVAENPPPVGISFEMGGQNKEMEVSFNGLKFAMALAIFLVYLVMAATFENLIHPFIILFTIPLALVGVVWGLKLADLSISVIALIGVIFLVGVVVNNAIVLVDAVNQGRRHGLEKLEAVVRASKIRLRPIMMTTITTVLGLLPMAVGFGEGAELRRPMAVVVTVGLAVATLLTLVVIPAVYMLVPSRVRSEAEDEQLEAEIREAERLEAAHEGPAGVNA